MIVPVLKQLLGKNPNLELLIVGILELPVELKLFASQIQMEGFVDYQKLPERIASVDINLAPLTDTIFNRAKSENKWVEAALVQTVTAASNLGAFAEMVQDGEDGVLCRDEAEWLEKLQWLMRRRTGTKSHCRTGIWPVQPRVCHNLSCHRDLRVGGAPLESTLCLCASSDGDQRRHPRCTSSCGNAGKSRSAGQPLYSGRGGGVVS